MEIWLVSHYAMPPHLEQRPKTIKYAHYLQELGHNVLIFTASTIHNSDIQLIKDKRKFIIKRYGNLEYVHIKVSNYRRNGIRRIINLLQFPRRFKKVASNFKNPDVIVADVNCLNYKGIYEYCKLTKTPFISDIRDLWPYSIQEYYHISKYNPFLILLYRLELNMYKVSDAIIFSIEGGMKYIESKKWETSINHEKIFHINNGIDISEWEYNLKTFKLEDKDLNDEKYRKIMYVGSIRKVNDLLVLIKAAQIVERITKNIIFIIYGDGDQKEKLSKYCIDNNVTNVKFKGQIEKKFIPYILSKSSINVLNYKATPILQFGASQNKLFDYFASGKPIILNASSNYNLVDKYHCGIVSKYTPEDTAKALISILNLDINSYSLMCKNSYNAAKDYDYKILTDKLVDIIDYAIKK